MPEPSSPVLAAVLAGGRASRLGEPKPSAPLGGRALIGHPLAALAAAGLDTVVVAKPGTPLPAVAVPVWEEPDEPFHPLCGVLCALRRAGGRPVLVLAADMPFVTGPLLSALAALPGRAVVARARGRLHPLLGRYSPEHITALAQALSRGDALTVAVEGLEPRLVDEHELRAFGDPDRLTFNVNTAADLAAAEQLLAG